MLSISNQLSAHQAIDIEAPRLPQVRSLERQTVPDGHERNEAATRAIPARPATRSTDVPFRTKLLATLKPGLCVSAPLGLLNAGAEIVGSAILGSRLPGATSHPVVAVTQSLTGTGLGVGMNLIASTGVAIISHLCTDRAFYADKSPEKMLASKKAVSAELALLNNPLSALTTSLLATAIAGNPVTGTVVANTVLCQVVGSAVTHPIAAAAMLGTARYLCLNGSPAPDSLRAGISAHIAWLKHKLSSRDGVRQLATEGAQPAGEAHAHTDEIV